MKTNWVDTFASFLVVEKCFWKIRKNIAKYYSCWKTKKKIIFTENCYYVTVCKNEKFTPFTWEWAHWKNISSKHLCRVIVIFAVFTKYFSNEWDESRRWWVEKMMSESNFLAIFSWNQLRMFFISRKISPL